MNQVFKGIITNVGEVKQGQTKKGDEYATRTFIATELHPDNPDYPQSGVFKMFKMGDYIKSVIDYFPKKGESVEIEYSLKAQEYNGKFYGDNDVFKITKLEKSQPQQVKPQPVTQEQFDDEDSLPF